MAAAEPIDDEVTVRGAHADPARSATLSRAEVREIPGTFGDPFRAIEIMPGVTPIVSGVPFFFVRGAPPGNVGYFLDGVRVPYLFHVGAGPSVVHPGLIDRVDLYPGGYPARFGRYAGGIVSGETSRPSLEARGEYNVRLFDAGALLETPFGPDDRGSLLVGGRYSYTGALLTLTSNTVLDYWDYQARVSYELTPKDTVSLFAFGASDFLGDKTGTETETLFGAEFYRFDLRYDHRLGSDGDLRTAVTAGLDRTRLDGGRFMRDRLVGARTELTYRISPRVLLRAGTDVQLDDTSIELKEGPWNVELVANAFPSRTDLTIGARADVVLKVGDRLEITPGARVEMYGSEGNTALAFDPRLATRTVITAHARLLAALGVAHQTPSFAIPLPGFQPNGLRGGLQSALQESMGLEVDLGHATTATATVFHNGFFNLSDGITDSRSSADQARAFAERRSGSAYGAELFVRRRLTSRIGGFLSYTLARSTRSGSGPTELAPFDRTHVMNAAIAYDLGRNWRAGIRVTVYSGLPRAPGPDDPGATRLAPFFRTDVRLEKRWRLGEKSSLAVVAEVMNATLSKESVCARDPFTSGCQEQKSIGPVTIPSVGVEGAF